MGRKAMVVAEIIDDIRRVFQVVNEQSKKAKRETGLTGPQLWAIKMIGELSPIRVSDLAARMYLHPATVVGILNRLELQGLIKRMRTNEDRRVVKIELTDAGNAIVAKAPQVAQGLLVAGLEVLPLKKLKDISCQPGRTGAHTRGAGTSPAIDPFSRDQSEQKNNNQQNAGHTLISSV